MNDIGNLHKTTCPETSKEMAKVSKILLVQLEETEEKIEALELFRAELLTEIAQQKQQSCPKLST